jgi:hypothetical protein
MDPREADQFTPVVEAFATAAMNCWVREEPTIALGGFMETVIFEFCGPLLTPVHEVSEEMETINAKKPIHFAYLAV